MKILPILVALTIISTNAQAQDSSDWKDRYCSTMSESSRELMKIRLSGSKIANVERALKESYKGLPDTDVVYLRKQFELSIIRIAYQHYEMAPETEHPGILDDFENRIYIWCPGAIDTFLQGR